MVEVNMYVELLIILLIAYQLLLFKSVTADFKNYYYNWKYYILMVIFTILFILSDLTYIITKNVINLNITMEYFINMAYYCSLALVSAFYFEYVEYSNRMLKYKPRKINAFYFLPLFIMIALVLSCPWTKAIFYIDENGDFQRGIFYALFYLNTYYFLIISLLKTLFNRITSNSFLAKNEYRKMFFTTLSIIIVSFIQNIFSNYPIMHVGYLIIFAFHYSCVLEEKYNKSVAKIDCVTNLSLIDVLNRGFDSEITRYVLVFSICGFNRNKNTSKFKKIFSLLKISNALRQTSIKYNTKIARLEGGKFVMLSKDENDDKIKEIFKDVVSNIRKIERDSKEQDIMKIRVGYCEVVKGSIGFNDYVDCAFEDLKR